MSLCCSNFILFCSAAKKDLSHFCSNLILFRFIAEEGLSSYCSNRFYVSLFYDNNIYFPFALNASFPILSMGFLIPKSTMTCQMRPQGKCLPASLFFCSGNNHTSKTNVFHVLRTISFPIGGSKNRLVCPAGGIKVRFQTR